MIADGRFGPRTCGVPLRVIWDLDLSGRARIVGRDQIDQLEAPVNVNPTKKIINPNLKSEIRNPPKLFRVYLHATKSSTTNATS